MIDMDESKARSAFGPGTIVAGKYRIDRTLAEGGMGFVVAGTHLHLDQTVALKFLRQGLSLQPDALARFTREAKAAAQLKSEYVARVLDAGITADGTPYMAMEYLEGESLGHLLEKSGRPLEVASAVEYVIQACEALAEAHSRGIVHRDIKPYNLFLVERAPGWRAIKILDFGISKTSLADKSNISTSAIIGSPCYMSPEQLRSTATVDHRTDLWSLGATLFELIAGHAPFDASLALPEIVAAILATPAPDLRERRPEVPEALAAIAARCLSKTRRGRFQSAGELAMALLPFAPTRARVPAERAASMIAGLSAGRTSQNSTMAPEIESEVSWPDMDDGDGDEDSNRVTPIVRSRALSRGETSQSTSPMALQSIAPRPPEVIARPKRSASRAIAAIAVAAGVAIAIAFASRANRGHPTSMMAATATPPAPSPPATATVVLQESVERVAAARAEQERFELLVKVSPASARLFVDGKAVDNPFRTAYPKDSPVHLIMARAWGYESKSEYVPVSSDTVVELALERRAEAARVVATPAPGSLRESRNPTDEPHGARNIVNPRLYALTAQDINASGGRSPRRPIDVDDPYLASSAAPARHDHAPLRPIDANDPYGAK